MEQIAFTVANTAAVVVTDINNPKFPYTTTQASQCFHAACMAHMKINYGLTGSILSSLSTNALALAGNRDTMIGGTRTEVGAPVTTN